MTVDYYSLLEQDLEKALKASVQNSENPKLDDLAQAVQQSIKGIPNI